jgi:hypothetical protein
VSTLDGSLYRLSGFTSSDAVIDRLDYRRDGTDRQRIMTLGTGELLVAEGDAARIEGEQPPARDRDAVSVAREIGEHRFGAGEGALA